MHPIALALFFVAIEQQAVALSSDDYLVRERATAWLQSAYPLSADTLVRVASDRRADPEARHRARRVLSQVGHSVPPLEAAQARLFLSLCRQGYAAWPWIDSLPECWPERSTVVWARLEEARWRGDIACGPPDYSEFRAATAIHVRHLLEAGMPEHCLRGLLNRMVDGDRGQCERSPTLHWAGVQPLRPPSGR
jgi:hypothetical protein